MLRLGWLLLVSALVAWPAAADVKVTVDTSVNAGPMVLTSTMVTWVKGLKMRTDTRTQDRETSTLVDLPNKQQLLLDHSAKTVGALDAKPTAATLPAVLGEAKISMKPTGQARTLLGRSCDGYAIELIVPGTMMGQELTMRMSGTVWVAKEGAGVDEFRAFQKAAAAAGLNSGGVLAGLQAQAAADVAKAIGEAGMPFEQEMVMSIEGKGQLGEMMSRMGNSVMTMRVTAVSTDPIADDRFAVPTGYTRK